MCAILIKTGEVDRKKFMEGLASLSHRGPDEQIVRSLRYPGGLMGHARLSIRDLSSAGRQPMQGKDFELVFNGEIYGISENGKSDTEYLVSRYRAEGTRSFDSLLGEYAIVVVDYKTNMMHVVIDHAGIKQLYLHQDEKGSITISSEIKGILPLIGKPEFDREIFFNEFLVYGHTEKRTLFKGITKIRKGGMTSFNMITGEEIGFMKKTLFEVPKESETTGSPYPGDLALRIKAAVDQRLVSDVPVSVTLSGGIDSSIIAYLASKKIPKISTYTLGFLQEGEDLKGSDLLEGRRVAKLLGTKHNEILVNSSEVFDEIEKILLAMEEPSDKGSLIPTWFLAKGLQDRVTLVGEGADEIFGGYGRHIKYFKEFCGPGIPFLEYFDRYIRLWTHGDLPYVATPLDWGKSNSPLVYDIHHELQHFHNRRIDKMFMAHSVEARVPYLDPFLMQEALRINHFDRGEKEPLRKAAEYWLPNGIINRPKKPLKSPISDWVNSGEVVGVLLHSQLNIFDTATVREIYALPSDFRNKDRMLWTMYLSEVWYKLFFK